ncbi:MAG: hypothetical protein A2451_13895 [Bdellovibrionales bacterium RIFOXYC2_FULL_39_8]|nr:MAG: hypothetical protein A2451_13895 [Bdellovibrionales bacterium RIFOXYC2_FULL_39_8]
MLKLTILLSLFLSSFSWAIEAKAASNPLMIFEYFDNDDYDKIIELINSGIDVNIANPEFYNSTPLMEVSFKLENPNDRYMEVAKLLLEKGADPNKKSATGSNALFYAVLLHRNNNLLNLFIKFGANLNDTYHDNGESLLHIALENGRSNAGQIFETLVKSGLNINAQDKSGYTPLMVAMSQTCVPQEGCGFKGREVQLLVDLGASLNLEDKYFGYTALKFGIDVANETSIFSEADIWEFEFLLKHGAIVDQEAVDIAASPVMKKLLKKYLAGGALHAKFYRK